MQDNINLKKIIEKYNIHPRKKFGQNFIFDSNILNKILNNILPVKGYNIIEIGPGPGGLTLEILKKKPKEIILIEIDPSFKDILNHLLAEFNTIKSNLIIDDFLNINFDTLIKPNTKIISNLPYYISTQILLKILPLNKFINKVMFTFQKEVADRITSKPNNKNYSRLSVAVQAVCNIKKIQNLSAQIFYPVPKIDSTVLVFTKREDIIIKDFNTLKNLTKKVFNKRRKSIKNSLKELKNISDHLNKLEINEKYRPEQISVDNFCRLANLIYETKK
jgi:16S rRNA (adenine1518-N6/adenine1519-N6)-dimethyltransferase